MAKFNNGQRFKGYQGDAPKSVGEFVIGENGMPSMVGSIVQLTEAPTIYGLPASEVTVGTSWGDTSAVTFVPLPKSQIEDMLAILDSLAPVANLLLDDDPDDMQVEIIVEKKHTRIILARDIRRALKLQLELKEKLGR